MHIDRLQVREVMTPHPVTVRASSTVRDAIATLLSLDVRHLPVVNDAGELVGMLSERDVRGPPLAHAEVAEILGPEGRPRLDDAIVKLMSGGVETVGPEDPLRDAVELMIDRRIGAVPVVSGGTLVGIVSYVDVLARLVDDEEPA